MKYLVTNADDLGWGSDITKGILDSNLYGVLSSASFLVSEAESESIHLIKENRTLGVGLHLNIATGDPISDAWRKRYGKFTHPARPSTGGSYSQDLWNSHYGAFDTEVIFEEFESQLNLFERLLDRKPDHIDTHYNTSSVKEVFDAYSKLSKKHHLPVRQPVGYRIDTANMSIDCNTSELVHIPSFLETLKAEKILTTNYFSLEYINLHKDYISAILREISKISEGESIEISFHPGYREEWRRKQVEILKDPELKKALNNANVKVITYAELKNIT